MKKSLIILFGALVCGITAFGQAKKADTVVKKPYVYVPSPVLKGFYLVPELEKRIEIYDKSLAQYPDTGRSAVISYSYARISMADDYAKLGDMASSDKWLKRVTNKEYHDQGVLSVSTTLIKKGDGVYADKNLKPLVDSLFNLYVSDPAKKAPGYGNFIYVYMYALRNAGRWDEIVHYLKPMYEANAKSFPYDARGLAMAKPGAYNLKDNMLYTYATALTHTGKGMDATRILAQMSLSGTYDSPNVKAEIKADYTAIPGGATYYTKLADSVKKVYADKLMAFSVNKKDGNGNTVDFKALKGKYILLDFWGSWCGPCRASHPHLKELYSKYKDKGFEIVGISQESPADLEQARKLWKDAIAADGLTWIQVLDNENRSKFNAVAQYGVMAFPTKILLDRDGNIAGRYIGNGAAGEGFTQKLEEIFGK